MEENFKGEELNALGTITAGAEAIGGKECEEDKSISSPFGKFKDSTTLLNAYNNLEKEFTKRSQKLAELEKQGVTSQTSVEIEEKAIYQQNDWQFKVSEFFKDNPDAKEQAAEISKILIENKDIAKRDDCLTLAYKLCLANTFGNLESLAKSENFLSKYITNNEHVKDLVISDYINSLKTRKQAPTTITGQAQSLTPSPQNKINGFGEAKKIVEKMFKR